MSSPARGRKLSPVIEYCELDDSDDSIYESSIHTPDSKIAFELDKTASAQILKGIGIGIIFGIGVGICIGKKLFS
jgi:hypothetical protein